MENSLHLDFNSLTLDSSNNAELTTSAASVEEATSTQPPDSPEKALSEKSPEAAISEPRERKKPYLNHERVKTGGSQRDKLSEEELTERMERIRQQNEKIKQRRVDVQADEDAFRKTQQFEKAKMARTRKAQESINSTREQNAKRKMDKIQSREWDSGKHSAGARNHLAHTDSSKESQDAEGSSVASSQWARGGSTGRSSNRGRGRGRGAKRGGRPVTPPPDTTEDTTDDLGWEPWDTTEEVKAAEPKTSVDESEAAIAL
ncbi:hypothetical protein J3R30DRAFT_3434566 [Lentinula aciculospora]|uniref:Uncharacterized protein n=1 Tax=Lentinula aciculospora TaxID=153920 RepID=A0A9W9DX36_9AGAR|nr:hypothetical protein J3R30DRAFT_3434566 [Lentinula aciculospora]